MKIIFDLHFHVKNELTNSTLMQQSCNNTIFQIKMTSLCAILH